MTEEEEELRVLNEPHVSGDVAVELIDKMKEKMLQDKEQQVEYWAVYDRLLHLLDHADERVRQKTSSLLLEVVCSLGLSSKERLLKACEALTWLPHENWHGTLFLLQEIGSCMSSSSQRAAQEAVAAVKSKGLSLLEKQPKDRLDQVVGNIVAIAEHCGERELGASLLLDFAEHCRIDFASSAMKNVVVSLEKTLPRMWPFRSSHGQVVVALCGVLFHRLVGQSLFPLCVLSHVHALSLGCACATSAWKDFCADAENPALLYRAQAATQLVDMLLSRFSEPMLAEHWAQWLGDCVRGIIDFCVRCPNSEARSEAWKVAEKVLDKLDVPGRGLALTQLSSSCPFGTVLALLCTRTKNEIVKLQKTDHWTYWWKLCVEELFPSLFRVPKDNSELVALHDTVMAGLNLMLFLVIRRKSMTSEEGKAVLGFFDSFKKPVEELLRTHLIQAKAQPQGPEHAHEITATELLLSVCARIDEFL